MARTREGRALTEAHRLAQIRLAEEARQEAAFLFNRYGVEDQGSRTALLAVLLLMLGSRWQQSQTFASIYLPEFRLAETGSAEGPVVRLGFPDARYGSKLDQIIAPPLGLDPADIAWMEKVEREILGEVQKAALAGGRSTLDRSARAKRVRYRRVSDGNPCAFCAALAGRGPVYSEETAYFKAHFHCGCTAEEVYGAWAPTALEAKWQTAYADAADQAKGAGEPALIPHGRQRRDTVLWRMRRNEPDLFSDGIYPLTD